MSGKSQTREQVKRRCPFCDVTFCPQAFVHHVKKCERLKQAQEGRDKYEKVEPREAAPDRCTGSTATDARAMGTKSDKDKIARSPTPPETEDEGDDIEWPVHGIVGEDVDVFGISSYEVRWKNWNRADGTNTTWQRDFEGDPALVNSWNDAMKHQRLQKATESQSIDLNLLASTPIHDRLTFERAQAVEEKMAERSRRNGACVGKTYQGWMAEIDRQVAHHERTGSEKQSQSQSQSHSLFSSSSSSSLASSSATTVPKKRGRQPSLDRGGPHAESSRSSVSRRRRVSRARDEVATTQPASGGDTDTIDFEL